MARREVATKLVDRTFLVGTLLTLALIVGFVVAQAVLSDRAQDHDLVATASAAPMAGAVAAQATDLDDKVGSPSSRCRTTRPPRRRCARGEADAWLTIRDGPGCSSVATTSRATSRRSRRRSCARRCWPRTPPPQAHPWRRSPRDRADLDVLIGDAEQRDFAQAMAFALAFLFYLSSVVFGTTLANSVVEEKQSRIVEIIATKIPVRQLLAGKVLGNTGLAVGQMALYAALGLVGLAFTSFGSFLPSVTGALGWFLVFFLVGFLLIACLWAVAGALASRTEDVQSTSTPVTMLLLGIFFGSPFLEGTAQTVLSYVPPASAVLMPQRIIEGDALWWEPVVALALLLVAAGVVVLGAERLYRRSLLQTQGRLSVREAWSAPE